MEDTATRPGIVEAPADWEAGNAATLVARTDYSRASMPVYIPSAPTDEANSDLGNLGRDLLAEPVAAGEGR